MNEYNRGWHDAIKSALKEAYNIHTEEGTFEVVQKETLIGLGMSRDSALGKPQSSEDCRNCKKWDECPCGKKGHENGTSQGYSIGECKDYEPSDAVNCACTTEEIAKSFIEDVETVKDLLDGQPSEDCVSREAVKSGMIKYGFLAPDMTVTEFVEDLKSINPQPKKGKWIDGCICSICGNQPYHDSNYRLDYIFCPFCGADMREQNLEYADSETAQSGLASAT